MGIINPLNILSGSVELSKPISGSVGLLEPITVLSGTVGLSDPVTISHGSVGILEPLTISHGSVGLLAPISGSVGILEPVTILSGTVGLGEPVTILSGTVGLGEPVTVLSGTVGISDPVTVSSGSVGILSLPRNVPSRAKIDISSTGRNNIIAPTIGSAVELLKLLYVCDAAVDVMFKSGSEPITGSMSMSAYGGIGLDTDLYPVPFGQGSPFNMFLGTAVQVSGFCLYKER